MRNAEYFVKTAGEFCLLDEPMFIYPGEFPWQRIFFDPIMVIQTGLRAPADMHGGGNVRFAPLHDPRKLFPIIDFLKREVLYRRAGNDHAVKEPALYLGKRLVVFLEIAR
ncbi:hypothetical protein SDC9_64021 [bioreactor metagenome]|uniref:Uncharacterized protein n=1 Tax=bioreactor metagenome TaxID=1076179 RepID=A0A644XU33_9ZZZZ